MTELTTTQLSRKLRDLNRESSYFFDNFTDRLVGRGPLGNVLPVVTDALTNVLVTGNNNYIYSTNIGEQLLFCPVNAATGLDISGDATAGDGFELTFQEPAQADARFIFTIDSEPVGFFIDATITVADVTGADELMIGFHENSAIKPARATYTDYALIGLVQADIKIATDLNDAGETLTDTTQNATDTVQFRLRVEVSKDGYAKFFVSRDTSLYPLAELTGTDAANYTQAYKFDTTDTIVPCVRILQHSDITGTCIINSLECGYLG